MKGGLCFRCEYRSRFWETERAPRYQCSNFKHAVVSCYMYKPVAPCITKPDNPKDKRPRFSMPALSSREHYVDVAHDLKLEVIKYKSGVVLIYENPNLKSR